ncbi:MAG: MgtC/SapB family protein, partial [Eubacteriales bacterium]|nr:MgtC/SapB family protein [Eubacteriales bacterium]
MFYTVEDPIASLLGAWSLEVNVYSVLLRILLSVALASVIGCERSSKRHSAGLRTFILVSLASTAAMLTDIYICENSPMTVSLLAPAAVVGIAMLSGNSILFSSRNQIKGLTTSAGLWTCGIIGLAVGAGLYTVTLIAFVALLCSLALFPQLEML